jgi:N-acetylmuramoyl-L-alanine amidase
MRALTPGPPNRTTSAVAALLSILLTPWFSTAQGAAQPAGPSSVPAGPSSVPLMPASPSSVPAQTPAPVPSVSGPASAVALAARLKARLSYDPLTGYGLFEKAGHRLTFALAVPWAVFDWGSSLPIGAPSEGESGPVFDAAAAAAVQKAFADAEAADRSHFSVAAILIDPGHGGKDPGAIGEQTAGGKKLRVVEKDVTLAISRKLYEALKARFPDKRILITREGDSYPSLDDRVDMANAVELEPNEAIVYVSIHANSSFNKNAKGFEVWYLNPDYRRTLVDPNKPGGPDQEIAPILNAMLEEEFTTESIILARDIVSSLQSEVGIESPNRGIRAEKWFVVRNARMPSVLVEAGFVTNPEEGRLLAQDDYLSRVADGVYNGLVDFVDYFESMRGDPSP